MGIEERKKKKKTKILFAFVGYNSINKLIYFEMEIYIKCRRVYKHILNNLSVNLLYYFYALNVVVHFYHCCLLRIQEIPNNFSGYKKYEGICI